MEKKKVIIVEGSPRKNGNSASLAKQVAAGAEAKGAEVESYYLHAMDIGWCTACDECREETSRDCVIEDDMQSLYPKLREADAILFAGPVYYFNMSAQTKTFLDRCYALGGPQGNNLAGKRVGVALSYGGSDPFGSGAVNALRAFQDAFRYVGAEIVGMVYGSATEPGEIKENKELMDKAYQLGEQLGG